MISLKLDKSKQKKKQEETSYRDFRVIAQKGQFPIILTPSHTSYERKTSFINITVRLDTFTNVLVQTFSLMKIMKKQIET